RDVSLLYPVNAGPCKRHELDWSERWRHEDRRNMESAFARIERFSDEAGRPRRVVEVGMRYECGDRRRSIALVEAEGESQAERMPYRSTTHEIQRPASRVAVIRADRRVLGESGREHRNRLRERV